MCIYYFFYSIDNRKDSVDSLDESCYTEERDDDSTDFTESLINEVHKRPALYDSKLPIVLRSWEKISQLWTEVFNVFGSKNISHALYFMIVGIFIAYLVNGSLYYVLNKKYR